MNTKLKNKITRRKIPNKRNKVELPLNSNLYVYWLISISNLKRDYLNIVINVIDRQLI